MGRKKYKSNQYASAGPKDCRFGMIYDEFVRSEQFLKLPCGLRYFYVICRVQAASAHGKACLYKHAQEYGITYTENDFVFPSTHMEKYGIDRGNGSRMLSALIKAGFIDRKETNKPIFKVNVYSFSARWKENRK